jgi:hypothetical protein
MAGNRLRSCGGKHAGNTEGCCCQNGVEGLMLPGLP